MIITHEHVKDKNSIEYDKLNHICDTIIREEAVISASEKGLSIWKHGIIEYVDEHRFKVKYRVIDDSLGYVTLMKSYDEVNSMWW